MKTDEEIAFKRNKMEDTAMLIVRYIECCAKRENLEEKELIRKVAAIIL